jgi:predicted nucleic acid-binding protein
MSGKAFFDTNVLIYAFATGDARKSTAEQLLQLGGAISVQVLNEFAAVSQLKLGIGWDEIDKRVEVVKSLTDTAAALTETIHDEARRIARTRKIAFYDALIVASAIEAGCDVLWTEDLQHGSRFGPVQVRNPFGP